MTRVVRVMEIGLRDAAARRQGDSRCVCSDGGAVWRALCCAGFLMRLIGPMGLMGPMGIFDFSWCKDSWWLGGARADCDNFGDLT